MAFPFFKKKKEDFSDLSALGLDEKDFGSDSKFQSDPLNAPAPSFQDNATQQGQTPNFDQPDSFDQPLPGQQGSHYQQQTAQPQSFSQMQQQRPQMSFDNKDFEIINAKLDSLRAMLENLNQRIGRLEQIAQGDNNKYKW